MKSEAVYKLDDMSLVYTRSYEYTPQNWLKEEWLNDSLQRRYEYDKVGNKRYVYDVLGEDEEIVTEYQYDGFGRVSDIFYSDGTHIKREYDALDNLTWEYNLTEFRATSLTTSGDS